MFALQREPPLWSLTIRLGRVPVDSKSVDRPENFSSLKHAEMLSQTARLKSDKFHSSCGDGLEVKKLRYL